jgi:signal peptidase I
MDWKPNRWLAALLALLIFPIGLLYLGGWRLAVALFVAVLVAGIGELVAGTPMYSPLLLILASAPIAFWVATKAQPTARPWYSRWYGMLAVYVGLFGIIAPIRVFLIEPFRVPSAAMEPGIPMGSYLIVSKVGYRYFGTFGVTVSRGPPAEGPKRGAIVVFEAPTAPGKHFFKRVLGLPGDTVAFTNKIASVNGKPLAKETDNGFILEELDGVEYQTQINEKRPAADFEEVVPAGHYFMVGDNRDGSDDSRRFGAVPGELLLGEVVYVIRRGRV